MIRKPVLAVLVPALVLLHFLLHVGFSMGRGAPDLLTLALLLAAREVGMGWAGCIGFLFGLLEDAFSVLSFGAGTLAMTLVGILGARTRDLFVGDSLMFVLFYMGSGKFLRDLLHWVVGGEAAREPFLNAVVVNGGLAALYLALVGMLLAFIFGGTRALR